MWALIEALETIRDFHFAGGVVLWTIGFNTLIMWTLIIERILFFRMRLPKEVRAIREQWNARTEHHSWHARHIRRMLIAQVAAKVNFSLPVLRMVVAICPLFGLLGTVTGMLDVFNVMNTLGTTSPRAMASGISRATLPTMAGMGAAIYGLFAVRLLSRHAANQRELFADSLTLSTPPRAS